jgi:hypothetical protein
MTDKRGSGARHLGVRGISTISSSSSSIADADNGFTFTGMLWGTALAEDMN